MNIEIEYGCTPAKVKIPYPLSFCVVDLFLVIAFLSYLL